MGANLVRRLMRDGHSCVAYDVNADAVAALAAEGATGATTIEEFVAAVDAYIRWYNEARIKSSLGFRSPAQHRRRLGIAA